PMLLRDFRNFIAVAETRSLSRAAARAHLAQPALSRQIHELERELGVPLLERHSKGVTPTAAGIPAAVEERVHQEDPDITLAVEDLDPPDTVEQVRAGAIDIALAMAVGD